MPVPPDERTIPPGGARRTDKGRANRVGLEVPVQLRAGGAACAGVTKNIGPGGVFVATVRLLRPGDRVTVTLKMQGDAEPVEALAVVRWCRPLEDLDELPPGVGLQFIDTPLRAALLAKQLRMATPR